MSSSDEAFGFFREWMVGETKLFVLGVLESVSTSGFAWIKSLDDSMFLANPEAGFSMRVPLEGCTFEASDPEHTSGLPALDELGRRVGFKFGWEIVMPSTGRILLAELEETV
jgi:hypothetical protein